MVNGDSKTGRAKKPRNLQRNFQPTQLQSKSAESNRKKSKSRKKKPLLESSHRKVNPLPQLSFPGVRIFKTKKLVKLKLRKFFEMKDDARKKSQIKDQTATSLAKTKKILPRGPNTKPEGIKITNQQLARAL